MKISGDANFCKNQIFTKKMSLAIESDARGKCKSTLFLHSQID